MPLSDVFGTAAQELGGVFHPDKIVLCLGPEARLDVDVSVRFRADEGIVDGRELEQVWWNDTARELDQAIRQCMASRLARKPVSDPSDEIHVTVSKTVERLTGRPEDAIS
jgi:hypothetical protein